MINKDFKAQITTRQLNFRSAGTKRYPLIIAAVICTLSFTYMLTSNPAEQAEQTNTASSTHLAIPAINQSTEDLVEPSPQALTDKPSDQSKQSKPLLKWSEHTVKPGDNLAIIFSNMGLSAKLLHQIINSGSVAKKLQNIRPGQQLRVARNTLGEFNSLEYDIDRSRTIKIDAHDSTISAVIAKKSIDKEQVTASAEINNSLYYDGQQAGLSDRTIMELANIFGWDIDFALNLRKGDRFTVLYNKQYIDGKPIEDGKILAAEFINRGQTYQAVRYEYSDGKSEYFSPNGKSMRKSFLRSPIEFARISSHFNPNRRHPVLNRIRAHRGVDYAASSGTPIKSTGDGRVIFRGVKGGFGRVVIVKHGERYNTLYAHMSKYGRYKKGAFVKQGQTVGYVGMSGLATGPHLHYEFRMNGVHRNPLTVKFPAAKPIGKKLLASFMKQTSPLLTQLEQATATYLAANDEAFNQ